MKFTATAVGAAALVGAALAQEAATPCSKYTTALLMNNTGANQLTLLTLLVNTALIGNYTSNPGSLNPVQGILNPEGKTTAGKSVNLVKYFDGSLKSTNLNGQAAAINFLDGGGAAPLKMNKAADNETSNQSRLLTHLYQYFGSLLGCNAENFPEYQGSPSQSAVHRYMNLDLDEVTYFIEQVGAAATSFGVSTEDVTSVANTLATTFNVRCAPPAKVPASADEAASQSICLAANCPLAPNSDCAATGNSFGNGTSGVAPQAANAAAGGSSTRSQTGSQTGTQSRSSTSLPTGTTRPDGASVLSAVNVFGVLALGAAGLVAMGL